MCYYTKIRYTCGHCVFERRERCWGWVWTKLQRVDCCYACLTCTGGMPPACTIDTFTETMDRKCIECRDEEIEMQRRRATGVPLTELPPDPVQEPSSPQPSSSQPGPRGFMSQQGMEYPQDPPAVSPLPSGQQVCLPSPAVRESRFDQGESRDLGTRILSPGRSLTSNFPRTTIEYHGHRSRSSNRGGDSTSSSSSSSRRNSSQGPASASHHS